MKLLLVVGVLHLFGILGDKECENGTKDPILCCKTAPNQDLVLKNPYNCSSYYHCINKKPVLRPCPKDLLWNVPTNRCEWPKFSNCEVKTSTKSSEEPSKECLNGLTNPGNCCKTYSNWMNIFLKNKDDSKSYYVCVDGAPHLRQCPKGLIYNVTSKSCEWNADFTPTDTITTKKSTTLMSEVSLEDCKLGLLVPQHCCQNAPYWASVSMKNPEDCSSYYECDQGKAVIKFCPKTLHWSVKLNRCESPETANCAQLIDINSLTPPTTITSTINNPTISTEISKKCLLGVMNQIECCSKIQKNEVFLKNANNCNSYYECIKGTPVWRSCPVGLHWSVENYRCDPPERAQCETNYVPKPICKPELFFQDCRSGLLYPDECCKKLAHFTEVHLPNPENCATYYHCIKGKPVLRVCPNGLRWGVTAARCDWPDIAECGTTSKKTITTSIPQLTCEVPVVEGPSKECRISALDPNDCCKNVSVLVHVVMKNSKDCSTYYQCDQGKAVLKSCPAGLQWSVKYNRCEWPKVAGCEPGTTTGTPIKNSTWQPTEEFGTVCKPSNSKIVSQLCMYGIFRPEECCEGVEYWVDVSLRNRDDCSSYFQCVNGKPVLKMCPVGLHWGVSTKRCEWPISARCDSGPPIQPKDCILGLLDPVTCCKTQGSWYKSRKISAGPFNSQVQYKNVEDCGSYYQCLNETPVLKQCAQGLHWSTTYNDCRKPNEARCHETKPTSDSPTCNPTAPEQPSNSCLKGFSNPDLCCQSNLYWSVFMENSNDCETYYQCVDGKAVLKSCPAGLHWSFDTNRCEWPVVAKCYKPRKFEKFRTLHPSPYMKTDCINGLKKPELCCKIIPSHMTVPFRNIKDCETYYKCENGKPVLKFCPVGFYWSVEFSRCEHKDMVNCIQS